MDKKRSAILFGVNLQFAKEEFEYTMQELKALAEACHIEVVGEVFQNLNRVNKSTYIGTGKLEELTFLLNETEAELLICNDELSPSQIKVLEEKLETTVKDRTMLILDIFAERAKTREAQMQVEVAQLQYMLPRLMDQRASLGRQGGGAGLKNRGAGETKLELDRRKVEKRIAFLKKELENLTAQRKTQRNARMKSDIPIVSLVGYTNAGKSTIMNAILEKFQASPEKTVFEKDMLFATLETSVRKIELTNKKSFLLTDTVGFVNKLPHHLIKAFRSTLEEVVHADLIIHVVDCSEKNDQLFMEVTDATLKSIGIQNKPIIYAYNKADLIDFEIPYVKDDCVFLSAKERVGLDELIQVISKHIFKDYVKCEMIIPYQEGQLLSYFMNHASVEAVEYLENGTKLKMECKFRDFKKYQKYVFPS